MGASIRIEDIYENKVKKALSDKFGYKNKMMVPKITKVVLNRGIGEAANNSKAIDAAVNEFTLLSGQKPVVTKAKKSIAGFKIREGMPIGCKVTLRGKRMYDFLNKLINISLPKVKDFRGIPSKAFDGMGNYTFGLKEQLIFPEINYDSVDNIRGMDITIVTTAKTDEECYELLANIGMPFRK